MVLSLLPLERFWLLRVRSTQRFVAPSHPLGQCGIGCVHDVRPDSAAAVWRRVPARRSDGPHNFPDSAVSCLVVDIYRLAVHRPLTGTIEIQHADPAWILRTEGAVCTRQVLGGN